MSDQDIEEKRLDLDRERLNFEREQWQREAAFKKIEQDRSRWTSPLVIAIFTAALAGLGNIVLAFVNGSLQRASDTERARETRELEKGKSEGALVLEMIKTADPDKAATNLGFLADSGLLSDKAQVERIHVYLKQRTPGQGPSLPLAGVSRGEEFSLEAGRLQNALGDSLLKSGQPNAAVAAYREALKVLTRERVPLDWAKTQNNLGGALSILGQVEEAVAAYREALKERTRERVPLDWAETQNNLGEALLILVARVVAFDGAF